MSVPRKMQEFAALYGCEIVEKPPLNVFEDSALYAVSEDSVINTFICHSAEVHLVSLNGLKVLLQRVSGRTLAQFWTGGKQV